ncbi:GNAT family N-acetyltransferase [Rothia sp. P7181]|uniref:GNAT family N-acetyltransferase n=1 Tax=Rothia sp. P7181 TaxID=3402663 RepID=UPI003ADA3947
MIEQQKQPDFTVKSFDELTLRELHGIYCTRAEVFTRGQKITEPDPDETDINCIHMFHQDADGTILAYIRMFDCGKYVDESHELMPGAWTIGRVAVHEKARGMGLGRTILETGIRWIKENTSADRIELTAQSYLKDTLYREFEEYGEEFMEAGIPHVHKVLPLHP